MLTNPIWVIKTRLQLQRVSSLKAVGPKALQRAGRGFNPYRGFAHAVRQIAKEEGLAGFYKGLFPSLLLVSPRMLLPLHASTSVSSRSAATANKPHRMHHHAADACNYAFAVSVSPLLHVQVSHGAIQFMVYEELKKLASGPLVRDSAGKQPLTSLEISVIGAVSKLAASIVTYPTQVCHHASHQMFTHSSH